MWREAAALFWLLAIGAALALIGQTYQVPENMALFLKAWWWLGLPILFLLPSYSVWLCLLFVTPFLNMDFYTAAPLIIRQSYFFLLLGFLALQWQYGKPYAAQSRLLHWAVIIFCFVYSIPNHIPPFLYDFNERTLSGTMILIIALYLFAHATSTPAQINRLRWFSAAYLAGMLLFAASPLQVNLIYGSLDIFQYAGINLIASAGLFAFAARHFYRRRRGITPYKIKGVWR